MLGSFSCNAFLLRQSLRLLSVDVVGHQIKLMEEMVLAELFFRVQAAVFVCHKLVKRQAPFTIRIIGCPLAASSLS